MVTEGMSARTDRLLVAGEAVTEPAAARKERTAVFMMSYETLVEVIRTTGAKLNDTKLKLIGSDCVASCEIVGAQAAAKERLW